MKLSPAQLRQHVGLVVVAQPHPLNQLSFVKLCEHWEKLMAMEMAEAFAAPDGFLLALYTPDLISGKSSALAYLWMVSPSASPGTALRLFREWENDPRTVASEQKMAGCIVASRPEAMARLYRKLGYSLHSMSFQKRD